MGVLRRTMLLVDARHGVKPQDEEVMAAFDARAVPYQVCVCARAVGERGMWWWWGSGRPTPVVVGRAPPALPFCLTD